MYIDKINVSVLYIVTFHAEQHTRRTVCITKQTSLTSVLLRDEESDALHKINNYIYKDTEYKYSGCQNMSSEIEVDRY